LVDNNKEKYSFEKRIGYQVYLEGLKRGLFIRPLGDVVYFIPPLVIAEEEIEVMLNTAHECINAVLK